MNEYLQMIQKGIQNQPFAQLLGIKEEDAGEGYAVVSCKRRDDLLQQTGTFHGGVIAAVCEAASGYASLTVLPEGESMIGVEYKINYLRAITTERMIAKAHVVKKGRQFYVVEVDAYNEGSDKIAAKMVGTGIPVKS